MDQCKLPHTAPTDEADFDVEAYLKCTKLIRDLLFVDKNSKHQADSFQYEKKTHYSVQSPFTLNILQDGIKKCNHPTSSPPPLLIYFFFSLTFFNAAIDLMSASPKML